MAFTYYVLYIDRRNGVKAPGGESRPRWRESHHRRGAAVDVHRDAGQVAGPRGGKEGDDVAGLVCALCQCEERTPLILVECEQVVVVSTQHGLDLSRRTVPTPDPHHLWRRTKQKATLAKVRILGYDRKPMFNSVGPDGSSSAACSPRSRTCIESGYRSDNELTKRGGRFWSKRSLTVEGLISACAPGQRRTQGTRGCPRA